MPTVPVADNFKVLPSVSPSAGIDLGISPEQATVGARQITQQGEALTEAGTRAVNVQVDALQMANQLRVDDALNQVKETSLNLTYDPKVGYQQVKGVNALQRESGKTLAEDYGEMLQKRINDVAGTLGNDAQKQAFMAHANDMLVGFKGGIEQHEGQEFQTFGLSVREGTIKNRRNEIALNYRNPAAVDEAVTSIQAAVYDQAKMLGKSAEWAEAQSREATSSAHALAISTALEKNDTTYADLYLKKYAKEMSADDILQVNGTLTPKLRQQKAFLAASSTIQEFAPKITTSDSDRAFNIAIGQESGGMQFGGVGSVAGPNEPTTSPKGAIGVAQIMPGTGPEAAKLAGLEWDENKYKTDATYNRAIGKAYFDKQLRDFNGNLAQAYAAYNAGPGAMQKAADDAKAEGKPENWLAHLPAETQGYVSKNMRKFGVGQGQFERPTLVDIQKSVREKVGGEDPETLKMALDEAERQYNDMDKAIKQRDDDAVANAMRGVLENGGKFTDLPANVRGSLPPEKVGTVMDFAKKVSLGDDTTNLYVYQQLSTDPTALKNMSDDQFFALRSELSQSDFKHFSDLRGALVSGTSPNGPGDLNNEAIKRSLDDRMISMGFDPNPKDKTSEDAQQMGAIRQFVNQSVAVEQANRGKKMTGAEVSSYLDQLFAQQVPGTEGHFLTGGTFREMFGTDSHPLIGTKVDDIPYATKEALKASFKKQGIDEPTDGDILNAYMHKVMMSNKAKAKAKNNG